MADNTTPAVVIPLSFDTSGLDAQIEEEQQKLLASFNRVKGLKFESFGELAGVVNQSTPLEIAALRGGSPQAGRALDTYNRFATSGQSDSQLSHQRKEELQLTRNLNHPRRRRYQPQQT